jgi:polysaccharide export outer membrane protein
MKNIRVALAALLLSSFLYLGPAAAQTTEAIPANLPAQKIGADDLLSISVYDSPELTRTVRVSSEGQIRLPMLKRAIPAAGVVPRELEAAIAESLRAEQILVDPVVTVTVAEYRSRPITVSGAVKKPLTFQAFGNVTLLDAIARAEGLAPEAGNEILLVRPTDGKSLTERISVNALLGGARPELNPHLSGGEEIRVPEAGKIYVAGNVKSPGAFTVKDASDATVLKVLALAGGLAPYSSRQAYIYRRKSDNEARSEVPVELNRIMARKSPDVTLAPDDILYVPDAKGRRMSMTALERIVGFGVSTGSGVLIWH